MINPAEFIVAGKATFTIKPTEAFCLWLLSEHGRECQDHYTYKIARKEGTWQGKETVTWFVSLLTGPDNWTNYTYMGLLDADKLTMRLTAKSRYKDDTAPVLVLRAVLAKLAKGQELPEGSFYHEGKCGRCGRKLTTPESVERGIGPECWTKI